MDEEIIEIVAKQDNNGNNKVVNSDNKNIERQVDRAMSIFDDLFEEIIWRNNDGGSF